MEVSIIQSSVNVPPLTVRFAPSEIEKKWWQVIIEHILPNQRQINRYITQIFCVLFLYAIFYGMLGDAALPGSAVFAIFVIVIAAFLGGRFVSLFRLPPLVGMLLVGFGFRNIKGVPFYYHIPKEMITHLRLVALSIILLRAGVGLDGGALKKLKLVVLRLTVCPELTEVVSMGIFGHYILGLPFIFSFMLGFIFSAISPEVVLPPILEYERQRYGVSKGIPALIIGATSLDDIVAIAGFTICFSVAFSTKDLVWTVIKAPLEPIIGFLLAVIFGVLFWYFPTSHSKKGILIYYNVLMVVLASMAVMFFSQRIGFAGTGPLCCIILAFIACIQWRKDPQQFAGVYHGTVLIWDIVEPVLFSLIGAEITVEILQSNAGWAIMALVLSLLFRTIMTYFITYGCNLNYKEKLFICAAYLPKASVQAAIGSQALDYARKHNYPEELVQYGIIVLNVCVLSLLLTAPLAAILIHFLGPVLLTKDENSPYLVSSESEDSSDEEAVVEGRRLSTDYSSLSLVGGNPKKKARKKSTSSTNLVRGNPKKKARKKSISSTSLVQEISEKEKRISALLK